MKSKIILSLFAICGTSQIIGCSSSSTKDMSTGGEVTKVDGTDSTKSAVNKMTLPTSASTFAFNIDGGGAVNQLGKILGVVNATGIDTQSAADSAVTAGTLLVLLDETSTDPTQQDAENAGTVLTLGNTPTTPPKYDGTDTFTVETSASPANFLGNIAAGGTFTSNDPATTTLADVELTVGLPLAVGEPPVPLPIIGGYITYTRSTSGAITSGQLNGAITQANVTNVVIPGVATLLTAQIKAGTASATVKTFDTNNDGTVTAAELQANPLISGLLAPDVQMYTSGVFKPNPARTTKDSLSLGLGFTAVKATF